MRRVLEVGGCYGQRWWISGCVVDVFHSGDWPLAFLPKSQVYDT